MDEQKKALQERQETEGLVRIDPRGSCFSCKAFVLILMFPTFPVELFFVGCCHRLGGDIVTRRTKVNCWGTNAVRPHGDYVRKISMFVVAAAIATATPALSQAQSQDIVETVVAAGNFKTLTKLLADAGLTETLKGPGPFTLFAPTDEAFAKVPAATLAALAANKSALKNVLLYHVVAGKVTAADVAKLSGKGAKTVQGSEAKVTTTGDALMVGTATVIKADVPAKNGVIHIIDSVLLPPK